MRIVFVSYNYSPDIHAPQEWVERINFYTGWSECLAKEHTVIRVDQINYEGTFTHKGIVYYFVDAGKRKNYFPWKLNRFVKSLDPDIVLVSSFLFPLQLLQLRNSLGKKVKIIIQHHAEKPMTGLKKYIQRYATGKADAFLFAAAEIGAGWVKNGNLANEKKIWEMMEVSSVFYTVDKHLAKEKTNVSGAPVFLWAGRLNQNKDPLTVVKGFLRFSERHPAAKLYMIYQSVELLPEVKELLSKRPGECPIILVGKVSHQNMLYWFNSADFFLSASHYESCGTALCEAMSCGCIPVVTAIPSFKQITAGACHGFLYPPGDAGALATLLNTVYDINIEAYSQKIEKHFRQTLSFPSIADNFRNIMAQL